MNITPKILSIPPYISTSWKNIASLHVENSEPSLVLIVTLHNGVRIEVPNLEASMIETVFEAHARYLELEEKAIQTRTPPRTPLNFPAGNEQLLSMELPFKSGIADMEGFGTLLQHNPEQADSPDLPNEVLEKITQISKSMGIDDLNAVPKPEPHCNCMRCQIAKAMQAGVADQEPSVEEQEEIVSDEELKFRTWDIAQKSDQLYLVTNPIDEKEHYNVFLGNPIGCTCGQTHCEHIKAVLNT
ncbi:MAG: hypothetical protein JSS60_06015 [Verrucomicrobia bacterium]|nr:hypothetical protein [Verrucomicrobiota bacterium]